MLISAISYICYILWMLQSLSVYHTKITDLSLPTDRINWKSGTQAKSVLGDNIWLCLIAQFGISLIARLIDILLTIAK